MSDTRKIMTGPVWIGLAAAAPVAVFTLWAYWHSADKASYLYYCLGFPAAFGLVCGFLAKRRLQAWLAGMVIGLAAGLVSAVPLLLGESFKNEFYASFATVVFFVALGFLLGATGEFVRLLHFVAHGGRVLEYPDLPPATEGPAPRPRP